MLKNETFLSCFDDILIYEISISFRNRPSYKHENGLSAVRAEKLIFMRRSRIARARDSHAHFTTFVNESHVVTTPP